MDESTRFTFERMLGTSELPRALVAAYQDVAGKVRRATGQNPGLGVQTMSLLAHLAEREGTSETSRADRTAPNQSRRQAGKRSKSLTVRLTAEEYERIVAAARAAGLSQADYIVQRCLDRSAMGLP